jgi:adenine-specific DNA-methyltransferase
MGEYFRSVTKPRIQKVIYSNDWKDGKPVSRDGVSQVVKYMALEQYEDALDNLGFNKSGTQLNLLASNPTFNEQYMLGYMLDVESRGSQSLLNIDDFADPFAYKLRITRNDDTQVINVDLIETFNYLLGLTVRKVSQDELGIVTITGENSLGENCLIIWRNVNDIDNTKLDAWFDKRYTTQGCDFGVVYVNGDNNIENMKLADDQWKVRLIEAEFKRLMFDVQNV